MICPLCESENSRILFDIDQRVYKDKFAIVKCNDCGIAWTNPLPGKDEVPLFYPEEYHGKGGKLRFLPLIEYLVKASRGKRAEEVACSNSGVPGKALDIGCGRGWMLSILQKMGWDVYGTELSLKSSSFARDELHLKQIYTKEVEECSFNSDFFDVVSILHVLEHLRDPASALKEINRILKKGGALIVEVPHFGGIQGRLFGNKWFHLDSPRHIYHFDLPSLKKYLDDSGFKVKKIKNFSWEYDPFGFVQSVLNFICFKFDYLYNFLRSREGRMLKGNPLQYAWDFFISMASLPFLLAISIPVSILSSIFRKGGTIKLYCIKEN